MQNNTLLLIRLIMPVLLCGISLAGPETLADANIAQDNLVDTTQITGTEHGLAAALQAAMRWHPSIKSKRAEIEASSQAINAAKSGRYPTVSAQANNINEQYNSGTLQVQQPLWAFGKIDTAIQQAKANLSTSQWTLTQVQRQLIADTAVAYARIQGIEQQLQVAQDNITEHDKLYQRIKHRQEGQLASVADVNLAFSRLVQAQSKMDRIRGEWLTAITELQALTQVMINTDTPIAESVTALPELTKVEALALEHSADLHVKREQAAAVTLNVKQEKVAALPTVYFKVEQELLDQVNPKLSRTHSGFAIEATLGGAGMTTLSRVKGAEARLKSSQYDIDFTANEVKRRVQTLMLNRNIQQNQGKSQLQAITAVADTMASFIRQYDTGRKSWIDVLNTQRELTELRYQLVQIDNEKLVISLQIAALIGNLDQMAGIETYNDNK